MIFPLYSALVRHLECWIQAGAVSRSEYKKDMDSLELIQCSSMKVIEELEHLSYKERLGGLGVFSLEKRRLRGSHPSVQISERNM